MGYHRNRRATKNTIKEGWLHTGDVAKYREDGQFSLWTDSRSSSKSKDIK